MPSRDVLALAWRNGLPDGDRDPVKLVSTVAVRDEADVLEAHLTYHLSAGVHHVVVADLGSSQSTGEILRGFDSSDVTVVAAEPTMRTTDARALLRRVAVETGATWLIESAADEFWWPRGASLTDVLDPIPTRYTAVQALVRVFFPRPATDSPFHERMTVRPSLLDVGAEPEPLEWALRSVHRVRHDDIAETGDGRSVPLRAWYPIEVLRFPLRTPDQAAVLTRSASHESRSTLEEALLANPGGDASRRYGDMVVDDEAVQHGLDSGALVEDVRLRVYLRALGTYADSARHDVPSIVDEAAYAIECAAIGEVDLAGLDRHIRELESRITTLEQRLWPRVLRRVSRFSRPSQS